MPGKEWVLFMSRTATDMVQCSARVTAGGRCCIGYVIYVTARSMGHTDGRCVLPAMSIPDMTIGLIGSFGALMSVRDRARDGGSYHVFASLAAAPELLDPEVSFSLGEKGQELQVGIDGSIPFRGGRAFNIHSPDSPFLPQTLKSGVLLNCTSPWAIWGMRGDATVAYSGTALLL
ncbi:Succinate--hydroxymethylglutarate CoA-transferase [Penicillium frequentans]|uniref:Succinate--hydroxymethylglutarate CoA-transferase n=1 Tax=Penicillium frequentans TaxID=3151616 RepID=A0AAD6CP01_9EURO|nr:Succinate--hydroxymethylglutarate CoA-transferase [Penicillium glabrum]